MNKGREEGNTTHASWPIYFIVICSVLKYFYSLEHAVALNTPHCISEF